MFSRLSGGQTAALIPLSRQAARAALPAVIHDRGRITPTSPSHTVPLGDHAPGRRDRGRFLHLVPRMTPLGSRAAQEAPAAQQIQMRDKITVVDALPEGSDTRLVGYHGATKKSFDGMAAHGVDFSRAGENTGGSSLAGPGLYVSSQYGIANAFAHLASGHHAFAEGFEPEVAAVHLAQPAGKLVEMPGPNEAEREDIEQYRASVSDAHQLNIDALQTVITPRAAESDDVNYFLVRRAAE
ncbi:hypothetical protein [Noviherbaspirillum sp.]|uniref:hypothetical protein n=1 Tax=Noviherbaspirillum sp. TaxID=1926288 RepID=UPI002FE120A0